MQASAITLRIPDDILANLKGASEADDRSISSIIVRLLRAGPAGQSVSDILEAMEALRPPLAPLVEQPPLALPQPSAHPIVSREEAMASEAKTYFTGKPCPRGHVAPRYVAHNQCVACTKLIK